MGLNIDICSGEEVEERFLSGLLENAAVISFMTRYTNRRRKAMKDLIIPDNVTVYSISARTILI